MTVVVYFQLSHYFNQLRPSEGNISKRIKNSMYCWDTLSIKSDWNSQFPWGNYVSEKVRR